MPLGVKARILRGVHLIAPTCTMELGISSYESIEIITTSFGYDV